MRVCRFVMLFQDNPGVVTVIAFTFNVFKSLKRREDSGNGTDTDSGDGFDLRLLDFKVYFDDMIDRYFNAIFYATYCAKVGYDTWKQEGDRTKCIVPYCFLTIILYFSVVLQKVRVVL